MQTGHRLGTVVAGVSLAPYSRPSGPRSSPPCVLALAVLVAVGLAAGWLINRALRPVARMTRQARRVERARSRPPLRTRPATRRAHAARRTLDDLLERLAASLRHEQRLSAEISHELRTPLANIVAEAQYALRYSGQSEEGKATLEHILQSARRLGQTLDTLMAAARAQLDPRGATSDAAACAYAAIHVAIAPDAAGAVGVSVTAPDYPIRVAVEPSLVERILAPLLDNAVRHARHMVRITVERDGDRVQFAVQDDGPGVSAEEQELIFEPGYRATGTAGVAVAGPGAGLGLALCRRLARSAGGEVRALPGSNGASFVVRLPAA